jgi:Ricin-type beta-trefoil lectin domain-like
MTRIPRVRLGMLIAIVVAVGLVAPATAASAANNTVRSFVSENTNKCLDDSSSGLRALRCNGLFYQQWVVHVQGDGTWELRSVATGLCLDDSGSDNQDVLRGFSCNNLNYQNWRVLRVVPDSLGGISLQNVHTGRCLDDSGDIWPNNLLRAYPCNFESFQRWV